MSPSGRVVPDAERCREPGCQSSRNGVSAFCGPHNARMNALKAAMEWAARRREWIERERIARRTGDAVQAVVASEARAAAVDARLALDKAHDEGLPCPAHPSEGLLDCVGCESIAEDAIQSGGGNDE